MEPNQNTGNVGPSNGPGNNAGMNLPPQPLQTMGEVPAAPPPASAVTWLPPSVPVKPTGPAQGGSQASAGQTAGAAASIPSVPSTADDGDLIEKEWVMKAKQIVEQTKQDPYKQTRELHKFRAEYMKKRYNKVIEPVED